ncbi:MAG TPA: 2-dehydropantoate 2-reductase [Clostridia bacterium]|nr:2-dehydropantoate 2-reductase [Clostridia bacterium]
MRIEKVSIVGLGALGILFGNRMLGSMPRESLRVIADRDRLKRYEKEKIYCNGQACDFYYMSPEEECEPADLLIFAVKYNGLESAVQAVRKHVGENTVIISVLNGISSETIIGNTYGMDKILYCVAQGMDGIKTGNSLTYEHMGMLCIGEGEPGIVTPRLKSVAGFFEKTGVPYEIDTDMYRRYWGKFMLNVGVNQAVAVYGSSYGEAQKDGKVRNAMISAMREVIALSEKEGVNLTGEDLNYWLEVLAKLRPEGKPSMRQDMEARRYSEVELFAGTVLELGQKHGIPTPVNRELYDRVKAIEARY